MGKFEVFQELSKCVRQVVSKCCWKKKNTNRFAHCRVATNLQFVGNTVSVKHNKAKCNKTRYACVHLSKLIECIAPRVNPNVNYGLWVIMTCQCSFINCSKCIAFLGDVRSYAYVGAVVSVREICVSSA